MANFFESLLGTSTDVYITISQSNLAEMAVMNKTKDAIDYYAQTPIEYNEATREIENYDILKTKIQKLYEECNISPQNSNVFLSVPTVWFGYKDGMPLELGDSDITGVVIGELEQTYIFKSKDPVPFYFPAAASDDITTKGVFYTAIQSDTLDSIRTLFTELGANLVRVDISLFSDLRALITCGFAEHEMNSDSRWSLMTINNRGFQLFDFAGKDLTQYSEEVLPVKSFEGDEIYSAIDNAAQVALMNSNSETLVLLSETDLVSAEVLSERLQFNGKTVSVEDNKFRREPLNIDITHSLIPQEQTEVSLQMLGIIANYKIFPVDLNFLNSAGISSRADIIEIPLWKDKVLTLTKPQATLYSIILLAGVLIIMGLGCGISYTVNQKYISQIEEVDGDLADVEAQLKQYNGDGQSFDPYKEIEQVLKYNRTKIMAYSALGDSIPKDVYLTYFMTGEQGYIDIQGCANTVEDIYIFFQNLKDSLFESNLRLSKLDLKTESLDEVIENSSPIDKAPYVFEITNMDENQLSTFMNALRGTDQNQNNAQGQNQDQNQTQDNSNQNNQTNSQ